jgi:hypothetical protein
MSSTEYNYTERSWAIDLIGEINDFVRTKEFHVRRATGERTLRTDEGSLFPDVLLHPDSSGSQVLQGWELKMPDTPVTDSDLLQKAQKKANHLNLNSFLVWNVNTAVLYTQDGGESFSSVENWHLSSQVEGRDQVQGAEDRWVSLLQEILRDLNSYFSEGSIVHRDLLEAFSKSDFSSRVLDTAPTNADYLKEEFRSDGTFRAEVDTWWASVESTYDDDADKFTTLSRSSLMGWINKITFSNVLKRDFLSAREIENIGRDTTVRESIEIVRQISESCDFLNIFDVQLGEKRLCDTSWSLITQLNDFFGETDVDSVDLSVTQRILRSAISSSRRKTAGQFTTPPPLADLLVRLTIGDTRKMVMDPCCGTGTIVRKAYELKQEVGISPRSANQSIWSSDKFPYQVQVATLSMADPELISEPLQIFQSDVLDLKTGREIELQDPDTGEEIAVELPEIDYIVSNLPFVQFEDVADKDQLIEQVNTALRESGRDEVNLSGRSDLYAYLPFYLWTLLGEQGKLGIILPNAWLGTNAGRTFRKELQRFFQIELIAVSGEGKWFRKPDVVTSLVVLKRKSAEIADDSGGEVSFATLQKDLHESSEDDIQKLSSGLITATSSEGSGSMPLQLRQYSHQEIEDFKEAGLPWSAFFADLSWIEDVKPSLIEATEVFDIGRGERRGWNRMFYPSDHDIEDRYIENVLRSSSDIEGYVTDAEEDAFCCSVSKDTLRKRGDTGALSWINRFETQTNSKGKPLPEKLDRSDKYWYEMTPDTLAHLVLSMNPDKRLFFARLRDKSFVDQRLIRFTTKSAKDDIELYHALLNSIIGLFYIEALGFGRGLGALDLNKTEVEEGLMILDPSAVSSSARDSILQAFQPLRQREPKPLPEELSRSDRENFDQTVLSAFDLAGKLTDINQALVDLYGIRKSVESAS